MKTIKTIRNEKFLGILSDVKEEVLKIFGDQLKHLVLYGSYARNESDNESDIDIMILVEASEEEVKAKRYRVADIMTELSIKHEKLISLTEVPLSRFKRYLKALPFYRNVDREGIEIYGKRTA